MRYTHQQLKEWLRTRTIGGGTFGVTYLNVGSGSTPPTQAQAANVNSVKVQIVNASTGTGALAVTHNLALPASDISSGWPNVALEPLDNLFYSSNWYIQSLDPNYVGLGLGNSSSGYDTSPQLRLNVMRPNTLVR